MSTKKVLIVEDHPINLRLIKMILQKENYNLLEASDGEEALEKIIQEKPNLVLMDIQLPKLNGFEVMQKLKGMDNFKSIPVVALTAFAMKGDKEKMLEAGFVSYLPKPFRANDVLTLVKNMLSKDIEK